MKYRAVLFDLDDTLLKTYQVKWAQHQAVAQKFYNLVLTEETLREHWGKSHLTMMAAYYQNSDTPENMVKANLSLEAGFPKKYKTML